MVEEKELIICGKNSGYIVSERCTERLIDPVFPAVLGSVLLVSPKSSFIPTLYSRTS